MSRCHGGLRDSSLVGADVGVDRSRGAPDRPEVCQAVFEKSEERHGGCRGHRGGGQPTNHAFRRGEDAGAAESRHDLPAA